jgi:hypothetical protein
MSFADAPSTKNCGFSNSWVTRWTSDGARNGGSTSPYKHRFLSFSKSNSISLKAVHKNRSRKMIREKTHLNFRLLARHSFPMRSTFSLQASMAFCSSFVTSNLTSCLGVGLGTCFAACFAICFAARFFARFAFFLSTCLEVSTGFGFDSTLVTVLFFAMMRESG